MTMQELKPLFIRKYGGTSVAGPAHIKRVAAAAVAAQKAGMRLALVVSAMSGETNRLIALAQEIAPVPSLAELAVVAATGEQVVSALTASAINAAGGKARSFLGHQVRIVTDSAHSDARIRTIERQKLLQCIDGGEIPVIAGYQGVDDMGNITTLGRGGSDTTAVAVACALNATACEIFTDVDGVYTADPNVCKSAKKLEHVSYAHMLALSALGAKVLHERSVALAAKYSMPVHVRTSFEDTPGTWMTGEDELETTSVASLAVDKNVAQLDLIARIPAEAIASLIGLFSENKLRLEVVSHGDKVSLTIRKSDIPRIASLLHEYRFQDRKLEWTCDAQVALVSLVGRGLQSDPATVAKAAALLDGAGITVRTLRTTPWSLSFLVDNTHADAALTILHEGFALGKIEVPVGASSKKEIPQ